MWIRTALLSAVVAAAAWGQDAKPTADDLKKKDEDAKEKIAEYKKAMSKAKADGDIVANIKTLGETQHPKILAELKPWLTKQLPALEAAGEAIAKYSKDKEAAEMLMTAAGGRRDKDGIVKCLRYAGDVGYKGIVSKLCGYFQNRDADIAREAVDSCAKLRSREAIDPLIGLYREVDAIKDDPKGGGGSGVGGVGGVGGVAGGGVGGVQGGNNEERLKRKSTLTPGVQSALEKISSESKPATVREWNDWWRKAKGTFKDPE